MTIPMKRQIGADHSNRLYQGTLDMAVTPTRPCSSLNIKMDGQHFGEGVGQDSNMKSVHLRSHFQDLRSPLMAFTTLMSCVNKKPAMCHEEMSHLPRDL